MPPLHPDDPAGEPVPLSGWAGATATVVAATAAASVLYGTIELTEIAMGFLLAIVFVAVRWGQAPAVLASSLSVASLNFFFVPPFFTFAVTDARHLLTFAVMFVVGIVVSSLTVRLRAAALAAARRERRMSALYDLGRELSSARERREIASAVATRVKDALDGIVLVLLPGPSGELSPLTGAGTLAAFDSQEKAIARWTFENGMPAGFGMETMPGGIGSYFPVRAGPVLHGVLGILAPDERLLRDPERRRLLEASCDLAGLALERVRLAAEAQDAHVRAQAESARSALLSSVSHDLRTPLATITGAASAMQGKIDGAAREELARTIVDEGERLNRLVTNLLDMSRLQAGGAPRREWSSLVEIVDSALRRLERVLASRPVSLTLAADLPMVEVDEVLFESAIANLLENAAKHTPAASPVDVTAHAKDGSIVIEVADRGAGIPAGREERIFEKFYRLPGSERHGGVGLGLAIVRAIVEAHGGTVSARSRDGGGAVFRIELVRGRETPPVPGEDA